MSTRHRQPLAVPPATNGRAATLDTPEAEAPGRTTRPAAAGLPPLLLTLREVAALLGVSPRTAKRQAALGQLPGVCRPFGRSVRVNRAELEAWVERGCPPLPSPRGRK